MTDFVADVVCICGTTVTDVISGNWYKVCPNCGVHLTIETDGVDIWPTAVVPDANTVFTKPQFVPGSISLATLINGEAVEMS